MTPKVLWNLILQVCTFKDQSPIYQNWLAKLLHHLIYIYKYIYVYSQKAPIYKMSSFFWKNHAYMAYGKKLCMRSNCQMQNHPPATHQSPAGWALVFGDWLLPTQEWMGYAKRNSCRTHYQIAKYLG